MIHSISDAFGVQGLALTLIPVRDALDPDRNCVFKHVVL